MEFTLGIVFVSPPRIRSSFRQCSREIGFREERLPVWGLAGSFLQKLLYELQVRFALIWLQGEIVASKAGIVFNGVAGVLAEFLEIEAIVPVGFVEEVCRY